MKTTLYSITEDYNKIISQYEEAEELTPELEEALTINENQLQSKSIAYLEVVQDREALNSRIDDEIKRLQAMKKQNNRLISNLKDRLLEAVKVFGSFDVGLKNFGTRKSEQVVVNVNANDLPQEYKTTKITETANKVELKRALKAGESIEGVELKVCLNLKVK